MKKVLVVGGGPTLDFFEDNGLEAKYVVVDKPFDEVQSKDDLPTFSLDCNFDFSPTTTIVEERVNNSFMEGDSRFSQRKKYRVKNNRKKKRRK